MKDARNVHAVFGGSVVDEIVTDRKAPDTRFDLVARASRFRMPSEEREPVRDVVNKLFSRVNAAFFANVVKNFVQIALRLTREAIPCHRELFFLAAERRAWPRTFISLASALVDLLSCFS